jgi:hypothetical protein
MERFRETRFSARIPGPALGQTGKQSYRVYEVCARRIGGGEIDPDQRRPERAPVPAVHGKQAVQLPIINILFATAETDT